MINDDLEKISDEEVKISLFWDNATNFTMALLSIGYLLGKYKCEYSIDLPNKRLDATFSSGKYLTLFFIRDFPELRKYGIRLG